jgi:hypothetical protein
MYSNRLVMPALLYKPLRWHKDAATINCYSYINGPVRDAPFVVAWSPVKSSHNTPANRTRITIVITTALITAYSTNANPTTAIV